MKSDVREWHPIAGVNLGAAQDAQVRAWIEQQGLELQMYAGEAVPPLGPLRT